MQCCALPDGRWQQARPQTLFRKYFGTDGQVAPETAGGVGSAAAKPQRIRAEGAQIDKTQPASRVPHYNGRPYLKSRISHGTWYRRTVRGGTMAIAEILGKARRLTQEHIVFGLSLALFLAFCVYVRGFLAPDNVLSLVQNVAILSVH